MHKAIKVRAKSDPWSKITQPLEQDIKELRMIEVYLGRKMHDSHNPEDAWTAGYAAWHKANMGSLVPPYGVPKPTKATHPEWFGLKEQYCDVLTEIVDKKATLGEAYLAKRRGEDALVWKLSR